MFSRTRTTPLMYMVKWRKENGEGIWRTTLPTQQAPADAADGIRLRKEGRWKREREEEEESGTNP